MKTKEELIQDYIENQLTAEDQIQFDNFMNTDPDFKLEVQNQQELHQILSARLQNPTDELRKNLLAAEQNARLQNNSTSLKIKTLIPYLAAACILVMATLFFFPWQKSDNLYSLPEMRSEVVRGEQSTENQAYEEAVLAFNQKKYGSSSDLLKQLSQENPEILQYQYYHGLSLMGEKKFSEALPHLIELSEGLSVFKNDASYYAAICYYELGDFKNSTHQIQSIPENVEIYKEAQKLLQKIKEES